MSNRHKVFVSYHHKNDQEYKDRFNRLFGDIFDIIVPWSVEEDEIDPELPTETIRQKIRDEYLADSTVTVVLVGRETWKRKHVDWEISSSIRNTQNNPRSGLLGIILPTYPGSSGQYNPYTIPPRLYHNIKCGFAGIYDWEEKNPLKLQDWIHRAFLRKSSMQPDNSYTLFAKNRDGDRWFP
jgi:hypothetical protein